MPRLDMKWDECLLRLKYLSEILKARGGMWTRDRLAVNKAIALIRKERCQLVKKL